MSTRAEIDRLLRGAATRKDLLSLAGGLPAPSTFPREEIAAAAQAATLEMGSAPMQYDWPEGRKPLRELIAADLRRRGADVSVSDVLITNGAQDAIAITIDLLEPEAVCVDPESYPGALELFRARGCTVDTRPAALRYAMPAIANPAGRRATAKARGEMLSARWVIEDDAYADLDFTGEPPLPPLLAIARDSVFHVGTFSKTLLPGLRVGWLVPPRRWLQRARECKARRDLHASGLTQAIVERYLLERSFAERLEALRTLYRRRRDRMMAALESVPGLRFERPDGGFSVWVETGLEGDDRSLLADAIEHGVSFDPGCLFLARPELPRERAMRISYSTIDEERIAPAVDRLAALLERARAGRAA